VRRALQPKHLKKMSRHARRSSPDSPRGMGSGASTCGSRLFLDPECTAKESNFQQAAASRRGARAGFAKMARAFVRRDGIDSARRIVSYCDTLI